MVLDKSGSITYLSPDEFRVAYVDQNKVQWVMYVLTKDAYDFVSMIGAIGGQIVFLDNVPYSSNNDPFSWHYIKA